MKKIAQITLSFLLILSLVQIHNCLNFDNFLTLNAAGAPPPPPTLPPPPIGGTSTNPAKDLAKIIEPWEQKKAKAFTDCLTQIIEHWDSLEKKDTIKETIKKDAFKSAWESISPFAKNQLLAKISKMENNELKKIFTDQGLIAASGEEAPEKQDLMAQEMSDLISALWKYTEAQDNEIGLVTKNKISNQFLKKFSYNKDNPQAQWEEISKEIEKNENLAIIVALTLASNFVNFVSDKAKEDTGTLKDCIKKINIKLKSFGLSDDNLLSYITKKQNVSDLETGESKDITIIDQFGVKKIQALKDLFKTKFPKPEPPKKQTPKKTHAKKDDIPILQITAKQALDKLINQTPKDAPKSPIKNVADLDKFINLHDLHTHLANIMTLFYKQQELDKKLEKLLAEINNYKPEALKQLHLIFDVLSNVPQTILENKLSGKGLMEGADITRSKLRKAMAQKIIGTKTFVSILDAYIKTPPHGTPPQKHGTLSQNLNTLKDDLTQMKDKLAAMSKKLASLKGKLKP